MQALQLRTDTLIEIGTFLVRRWSGKENAIVELTNSGDTKTRLRENKVILRSIKKLQGDYFQKYRQFRTNLWYEALRMNLCKKILSNDHAFGFILNTIETRRIELLGRKIWKGMDEELVFNYAYKWIYQPELHSVFGKARIVQAFQQAFLFGSMKGELPGSYYPKIENAVKYAKEILDDAIKKGHETDWLEKKIPEIIKILDIDSLITIPLSVPKMGSGMAITEEQLLQSLVRVSKHMEGDFGKVDLQAVLRGENVLDEYKVLLEENKKNENKGLSTETIGVRIPSTENVDETVIYDPDLINKLKTKFKEWKSGWKEQHLHSGDEFDEETYIEGQQPFFTDVKKTIKTKIVILLDHSSSIASDQIEYKKATLALCEVLSYLKVKFGVYAFNTQDREVVCWLVKPDNIKWNYIAAKRLAQIVANGGTPLAEVYDKMYSTLKSKSPDIFLTLTDGEPSDPTAVRAMIKSLKSIGIKMVALGYGPDIVRSTTIANNLKNLGYERTLAVSRLEDIPNKVLNVLGSS